jgi:hypothetical protein
MFFSASELDGWLVRRSLHCVGLLPAHFQDHNSLQVGPILIQLNLICFLRYPYT